MEEQIAKLSGSIEKMRKELEEECEVLTRSLNKSEEQLSLIQDLYARIEEWKP